jgi:hypothetical protein
MKRQDTCALLSACKVAQQRQGSPETPFWRLHRKNMLQTRQIGRIGSIVSGPRPCVRVFTRPRPTPDSVPGLNTLVAMVSDTSSITACTAANSLHGHVHKDGSLPPPDTASVLICVMGHVRWLWGDATLPHQEIWQLGQIVDAQQLLRTSAIQGELIDLR